mgnify:CR=1 FL=1
MSGVHFLDYRDSGMPGSADNQPPQAFIQAPLDEVTASDYITSYEIVYTEAFYDTMLYRAFMGYGPSDVGETEQGLPGISGSLQDVPSMQGWNMSNFRMVYRTAYYNPFPSEDVANHTDAW